MNRLDELENQSLYIIREAFHNYRNLAMLWSIGKDSTTLLWLIRKAFFGEVPFPVLHIDTTFKFQEIYDFRDRYSKEWNLNLLITKNDEALKTEVDFDSKLKCCMELKTNALKQAIMQHGFDGLLLGIRRDEHGVRAKERVFSPRDRDFRWQYDNQPAELWDQYKSGAESDTHVRIHPILNWTELDIWEYIQQENIPFTNLYLARHGKRYRSIGCETCCTAIDSDADSVAKIIEELETTHIAERAGRAQDKEDDHTMQKLRALGYM